MPWRNSTMTMVRSLTVPRSSIPAGCSMNAIFLGVGKSEGRLESRLSDKGWFQLDTPGAGDRLRMPEVEALVDQPGIHPSGDSVAWMRAMDHYVIASLAFGL